MLAELAHRLRGPTSMKVTPPSATPVCQAGQWFQVSLRALGDARQGIVRCRAAQLGNGDAFVLAEHPDEAELVAEGVLGDRPVDARFLPGKGRVAGRWSGSACGAHPGLLHVHRDLRLRARCQRGWAMTAAGSTMMARKVITATSFRKTIPRSSNPQLQGNARPIEGAPKSGKAGDQGSVAARPSAPVGAGDPRQGCGGGTGPTRRDRRQAAAGSGGRRPAAGPAPRTAAGRPTRPTGRPGRRDRLPGRGPQGHLPRLGDPDAGVPAGRGAARGSRRRPPWPPPR